MNVTLVIKQGMIIFIAILSMDMATSAKSRVRGGNMGVWTGVGIGVGAAIGIATGDLAMWTALGVAGGVVAGATLSRK